MRRKGSSEYTQKLEGWKHDDSLIRGDIARYLAMTEVSMADLGKALNLSKTTMYSRYKNPSSFTLGELRTLEHLFQKLFGNK